MSFFTNISVIANVSETTELAHFSVERHHPKADISTELLISRYIRKIKGMRVSHPSQDTF